MRPALSPSDSSLPNLLASPVCRARWADAAPGRGVLRQLTAAPARMACAQPQAGCQQTEPCGPLPLRQMRVLGLRRHRQPLVDLDSRCESFFADRWSGRLLRGGASRVPRLASGQLSRMSCSPSCEASLAPEGNSIPPSSTDCLHTQQALIAAEAQGSLSDMRARLPDVDALAAGTGAAVRKQAILRLRDAITKIACMRRNAVLRCAGLKFLSRTGLICLLHKQPDGVFA